MGETQMTADHRQTTDVEVFRVVRWLNPYYRVSNFGRVQTCNPGLRRAVQPWKDMSPGRNTQTGHLYVNLRHRGVTKQHYIQRLVLDAFVGPCPDGMEACHDPDPNPENNHIWNLRWDTHANNMKDQIRQGRTARGSRKKISKLNEEKVLDIRRLVADGMGFRAVGRMYGVSHHTISNAVSGLTWSHV